MGFSQRREDGEVRGRGREKRGKRAEIEGRGGGLEGMCCLCVKVQEERVGGCY